MAKLSLPKLEFDKKKAGIAGGALLVAVVGWFAWDMFMAEPPPPPPPPPVAAKPPAPKPPVTAVTEKPAEGEKKSHVTADAKPAADGAPAAKPESDPIPSKKPAAAEVPAAKSVAGKVPAMKAPSAPDMASPVDSGPRMLTARSKLDARECLKHETNQAIQQCAERFR
jgi:hypothetical protein